MRTAACWPIWPISEVVDRAHRVVFVDGIWVARNAAVPTTRTKRRALVVSDARGDERDARFFRELPPGVVITDGRELV